MNTLPAKACFVKLKTDTPLASNLSKTTTLYLKPQAKPKNLFSLLLIHFRLMLHLRINQVLDLYLYLICHSSTGAFQTFC